MGNVAHLVECADSIMSAAHPDPYSTLLNHGKRVQEKAAVTCSRSHAASAHPFVSAQSLPEHIYFAYECISVNRINNLHINLRIQEKKEGTMKAQQQWHEIVKYSPCNYDPMGRYLVDEFTQPANRIWI